MTPAAGVTPAAVDVAVLRGPGHPILGRVSRCGVGGGRTGGATSAGARPKDPPSIEPNEDGCLVATAGDRAVLAVVDGAGGFAAAGAVLDVLAGAARSLLRAQAPLLDAERAWRAALQARADVRARQAGHARRPHVAVSVVVRDGGAVWCATAGDTAVVAVGAGGPRLLSGVAPHLDHHAPLPQPQRLDLPAATLLLATDGVFDALGPAWPAVVGTHAGAAADGPPAALAEGVVRAALDAGAADHVTAVAHGWRQARAAAG